MTSHQDDRLAACAERLHLLEPRSVHGVDDRIAGDVNGAPDALAAQVGGAQFRRCKQQIGLMVDGDPEIFFRPRTRAIVASQPGLDMSKGYAAMLCGDRACQRRRRVTLDDQQVESGHVRRNRRRDAACVQHRVGLPGAVEANGRVAGEAMISGRQRVLPREDQKRQQPARAERVGDRCKLDGFGACADCKRNMCGQPSP